jgi:hypothetical protein
MSTINIIRSFVEFFMICGFAVTIYLLSGLRDEQKERRQQNEKPVQFTGKDFFSIDL